MVWSQPHVSSLEFVLYCAEMGQDVLLDILLKLSLMVCCQLSACSAMQMQA